MCFMRKSENTTTPPGLDISANTSIGTCNIMEVEEYTVVLGTISAISHHNCSSLDLKASALSSLLYYVPPSAVICLVKILCRTCALLRATSNTE